MALGRNVVRGLWLSLVLGLSVLASASDHSGPGISADEALKRLKEGNDRFVAGKTVHPNADAKRRELVATKGQHPFVTVLGCSDSRGPLELLFDQGIGDVFVIRVAGNVCNVDETGSIEYGVDHVGTPLLVVLGHSGCGAVTAVATGGEVHGSIPALVAGIRPAVAKAEKANPNLHGKDLVPAATEFNVWQAIDDLFKRSSIIRKSAQEGKVKVLGAIYDLPSGKVKWLGEHPEKARLLKYADAAGHEAAGHDAPKHAPEPAPKPAAEPSTPAAEQPVRVRSRPILDRLRLR